MLRSTIFAVALCSASSAIAADNLLENGDFEIPKLNKGEKTTLEKAGWEGDGTAQQVVVCASWAANNGNNGLWLQGWRINQTANFHQTIQVKAGNTYELSAAFRFGEAVKSHNIDIDDMALIWLNGDGEELSRSSLDVVENKSYTWGRQSLEGTAPAGSVAAKVYFSWRSTDKPQAAEGRSIMVDDIRLVEM